MPPFLLLGGETPNPYRSWIVSTPGGKEVLMPGREGGGLGLSWRSPGATQNELSSFFSKSKGKHTLDLLLCSLDPGEVPLIPRMSKK